MATPLGTRGSRELSQPVSTPAVQDFLVDGLALIIVVLLSTATWSLGAVSIGPITLVTFAAWLFLASARRPRFAQLVFSQLMPLMIFISYLAVVGIIVDSAVVNGYLMTSFVLAALRSLQLFYSRAEHSRAAKVMILAVLLEMVAVAVVTYFAFSRDPNIARTLASGYEVASNVSRLESLTLVGGYGFVYSIPPVVLALAVYAKFVRRIRVVILLPIVLFVTVLFLASYTIGLLLFILALGLTIIIYAGMPKASTSVTRFRVVLFLSTIDQPQGAFLAGLMCFELDVGIDTGLVHKCDQL